MAQKNATPTKDQMQILAKHGLQGFCWVVVKDLPSSMIVKNRFIEKLKYPSLQGEQNGF